jgi:hypothetical protein
VYRFRAFRAIDDYETCVGFLKGHVKVLIDYGITNITTNNESWMSNPNVYVIVAEREDDNKIIGGIRVHKADGINPLPVEVAIGYLDPNIYTLINTHIEEGTGELCGLWNAKEVAGLGISLLLIRAGISIVNQFGLCSLFTICAEYTLPMVRRVGFIVEENLGENGAFIYPNENYIARVLKKLNAVSIDSADENDRVRIMNLRNNPQQETFEIINDHELFIKYRLLLRNK